MAFFLRSRCIVCISAMILTSCGTNPQEPPQTADPGFLDTFNCPDSTTLSYWLRTGGTGDGYYGVLDSVYAHVSGGHCSYYRYDEDQLDFGNGIYEFDTFGPYWEFAWRITSSNPDGGYCRIVGNSPAFWDGYFMRPFVSWTGYPYAWRDGLGKTIPGQLGPDPEGLHHVAIHDTGTGVTVIIDSDTVFDLALDSIAPGLVGVGSGNWVPYPPDYGPWYDNISFTPDSM